MRLAQSRLPPTPHGTSLRANAHGLVFDAVGMIDSKKSRHALDLDVRQRTGSHAREEGPVGLM
nr:hypothetical protein JVH1_0785 [Rhodococcus sp. JVH1]